MDWALLAKALCLVLVIEGIPLFLAPHRMRETAATVARMSDSVLRTTGLVAMVSGAGLLVLLS